MSVQPSNVRYIDVDRLCDEAEQAGLAWADAKGAYEALKQTQKSVLAKGVKDHMAAGTAFNKAENAALADDEYADFLRKMVAAGRAADRARVVWEIKQTRIELLRTNASTERAAMSMR